jgi:hypothetical protein
MKIKKSYIFLMVISSALFLSGCAVEHDDTGFSGLGFTYKSNVKQQSDGSYFVEAEAALAAGRITGAKGVVNDQATKFCAAQNKTVNVIDMQEDSHLLINGVVRMTFKCI